MTSVQRVDGGGEFELPRQLTNHVEYRLNTLQNELVSNASQATLVAPLRFDRPAAAVEPGFVVSAFADQVSSALADNPHLAGRQLRVEAHAGRVTLHGVVNSYYQKQMAQEALRRLDGVREIENCLEVSWS
jgi:hypothetical protein